MTQNSSFGNLTRRSFIKRSVVATVAISSMTIFSGLVNASGQTNTSGEKTKCEMERSKACVEGLRTRKKPDGTVEQWSEWICFYKCAGKNGEFSVYCSQDGKVIDEVPSEWGDCEFPYGDLAPLIAG